MPSISLHGGKMDEKVEVRVDEVKTWVVSSSKWPNNKAR